MMRSVFIVEEEEEEGKEKTSRRVNPCGVTKILVFVGAPQ